jgi:hypothetical protein
MLSPRARVFVRYVNRILDDAPSGSLPSIERYKRLAFAPRSAETIGSSAADRRSPEKRWHQNPHRGELQRLDHRLSSTLNFLR